MALGAEIDNQQLLSLAGTSGDPAEYLLLMSAWDAAKNPGAPTPPPHEPRQSVLDRYNLRADLEHNPLLEHPEVLIGGGALPLATKGVELGIELGVEAAEGAIAAAKGLGPAIDRVLGDVAKGAPAATETETAGTIAREVAGLIAKGPHAAAVAKEASTGFIHRTAQLGKDVSVEGAIVKEGAKIGDGANVAAGSYIGANADIGANVVIESGVHIGDGVKVFPGCTIAKDTFIGRDSVVIGDILQAKSFPPESIIGQAPLMR